MNQSKWLSRFIIGTFVTLYLLVSIISTIHVIDFFELSNPYWLAVTLAIGFELGAAASLASLVILDKMNKGLVWGLFITITLMQMQGNMYYAFTNLEDFQSWSELFNLIEEEVIYQKRVLSFVSGAILPLVALGFIKSLVDYIKPVDREDDFTPSESAFDDIEEATKVNEEQLKNAAEDLEAYREEILGEDEDWDEDHALDQVLNDMVEDEDLEDWDVTLDDGLDEEFADEETFLNMQEDLSEKPESITSETPTMDQPHETLDQDLSIDELEAWKNLESSIVSNLPKEEAPEVESEDDSEEALFKKAMRAKGEENKNNFLKG